jgi:hypothetical protein
MSLALRVPARSIYRIDAIREAPQTGKDGESTDNCSVENSELKTPDDGDVMDERDEIELAALRPVASRPDFVAEAALVQRKAGLNVPAFAEFARRKVGSHLGAVAAGGRFAWL